MDTSLTSPSRPPSASPPLRAVLFDWGNTLVKFASPATGEASDYAALRALHEEMASWGQEARPVISHSCQQFLDAYAAVWPDLDGEIKATLRESTMGQLIVAILSRLLPRPVHDPWLLEDSLVMRMAERTAELIGRETQVVAGAVQMLESLRGVYPLGVVSNMISSSPVHQSLEMHGLTKYLSVIVVSAEVGYVKPSPVPFRHALETLGLLPEEALFVGDDPITDMQGAKTVGMRTVLLRRTAATCPEADFAVDSLGELASLVDTLTIAK